MRNRSAAFTLLELVVVLAILSIVTVIAVRSLNGVEDQGRYEASKRGMNELEFAVVGSPDDRAPDGTRTVTGFVADMGRLPMTVALPGGTDLGLEELWKPDGNLAYDVSRLPVAAENDSEVLVPGGWRGPYLRIPPDATNIVDGWGNPVRSLVDPNPSDPQGAGYPRLRDTSASVAPIITAGKLVGAVEYLGANGIQNTADRGVDQDYEVNFAARYKASVKTSVDVNVIGQDGQPAPVDTTNYVVIVRVYGPDLTVASRIQVAKGASDPPQPLTASSQFLVSTPVDSSTIGPRAVRAYLYQSDGTPIADDAIPLARSSIKYVTLVSGVNFIPLTIFYRPASAIH